MHNKDFRSNLLKECWRVNDHSQAFGLVMVGFKNTTVMMNLSFMNMFKQMGPKLENNVSTEASNKFRQKLCDDLYGDSLMLVRLNMATFLPEAEG